MHEDTVKCVTYWCQILLTDIIGVFCVSFTVSLLLSSKKVLVLVLGLQVFVFVLVLGPQLKSLILYSNLKSLTISKAFSILQVVKIRHFPLTKRVSSVAVNTGYRAVCDYWIYSFSWIITYMSARNTCTFPWPWPWIMSLSSLLLIKLSTVSG